MEKHIVVWAANQTFHAYLRQVEGRTLTFQVRDGRLVDAETESTWDVSRGLAIDGPLRGQNLPAVPSATAYDWAWQDFYPQTSFWQPASD